MPGAFHLRHSVANSLALSHLSCAARLFLFGRGMEPGDADSADAAPSGVDPLEDLRADGLHTILIATIKQRIGFTNDTRSQPESLFAGCYADIERASGHYCQLAAFCIAMEARGYTGKEALAAWAIVKDHPRVEELRQERRRKLEDEMVAADVLAGGDDQSIDCEDEAHPPMKIADVRPWRLNLRAGLVPGGAGAPTREQVEAM
eukprot:gene1228-biopygen37